MNLEEIEDNTSCNGSGLIYRGYHSEYVHYYGGLGITEGFRQLKRKSCKCPKCQSILKNWAEDIACGIPISVIPEGIRDGKLYKLFVLPGSPNWETGVVEDWGYEFRLIKDEDNVHKEQKQK